MSFEEFAVCHTRCIRFPISLSRAFVTEATPQVSLQTTLARVKPPPRLRMCRHTFPCKNQVLAPKRSWVPLRMKGAAPLHQMEANRARHHPSQFLSCPRGTSHNVLGALTSTTASDQGKREDDGHAQGDAVLVHSWLPGFPAYKMNLGRSGGYVSASTENDRRRRRHRDHYHRDGDQNQHRPQNCFKFVDVSAAASEYT
jgi:hypothetical protein